MEELKSKNDLTDDEIILVALCDYEESYYEYNDDKWQEQVNELIAHYRKKVFN